jgi:hypothetical protein
MLDVPVEETREEVPLIPLRAKIIAPKTQKTLHQIRAILSSMAHYAQERAPQFISVLVPATINRHSRWPQSPRSFTAYVADHEFLRRIAYKEYTTKLAVFRAAIDDIAVVIIKLWRIVNKKKDADEPADPSPRKLVFFVFLIIWFFKTGVCPGIPVADCLSILGPKPYLISHTAGLGNKFKSQAITTSQRVLKARFRNLPECRKTAIANLLMESILGTPFLSELQIPTTRSSYPPYWWTLITSASTQKYSASDSAHTHPHPASPSQG